MRHGQGESMLIKSVESLLGGSAVAATAAMAGLRCCLRRGRGGRETGSTTCLCRSPCVSIRQEK